MPGSWPDSWRALRDTDRDLALCLLFSPADGRAALADRLNLALEAENSVRVASEPMLAAIRLQWWVDAIEAGRHENVPLMHRLLIHMETGKLQSEELLAQLAIWQDRLADETITAGGCWQVFFGMLAGTDGARQAAGPVGRAMYDPAQDAKLDNGLLSGLRTRQHRWIWMAGQLARHRQSGKYREDDALLVWRMLGWRLGFRPPSPPSSP
ncbi:MAG: hypothetical protein VXZ67_11295 [Pseudomonadota bacterium]|nr:hypothetical protein [Pseudomonadota bacterium]